jgi:hypothetical protein
VHNHREHLQQDRNTVGTAKEAVSITPSITNVDVDVTDTTQLTVDHASSVGDNAAGIISHLSTSSASWLAVATRAMTAAIERLASAATRIEAAVHRQRFNRLHQSQHIVVPAVPNLQLHLNSQNIMLQQQRFVYYQQHHVLNWCCQYRR